MIESCCDDHQSAALVCDRCSCNRRLTAVLHSIKYPCMSMCFNSCHCFIFLMLCRRVVKLRVLELPKKLPTTLVGRDSALLELPVECWGGPARGRVAALIVLMCNCWLSADDDGRCRARSLMDVIMPMRSASLAVPTAMCVVSSALALLRGRGNVADVIEAGSVVFSCNDTNEKSIS